MTDAPDAVLRQALVMQTSAVLLTRGLHVEPAAVDGAVAHLVGVMAERTGVDEQEAVHLVTPEAVANVIMMAATDEDHQASVHAVRPVRVDDRAVSVPVESLGHLVTAASQAGKYASLNGAGGAASHLMDLATELGAALVRHHTAGSVDLPVSVLDELASLVEAVADRVEADEWSVCPCGEDHGQHEVDSGVLRVIRRHAVLACGLRGQAG